MCINYMIILVYGKLLKTFTFSAPGIFLNSFVLFSTIRLAVKRNNYSGSRAKLFLVYDFHSEVDMASWVTHFTKLEKTLFVKPLCIHDLPYILLRSPSYLFVFYGGSDQ